MILKRKKSVFGIKQLLLNKNIMVHKHYHIFLKKHIQNNSQLLVGAQIIILLPTVIINKFSNSNC